MKNRLDWLLAVPARRPRMTLLFAGLLTLAALAGAARLQVHAALDAMFPRHDPAALALTDVMEHFETADELLVLVTLPADSPHPDPDRLTAYAQRFGQAAASAPVQAVIYRDQPDAQRFIEEQLAPAGLFYLDDAQLAAAYDRLSPAGMRAQLARDQAMMSQPSPAAGALAKAMMQDPLFLHDFLLPRLNSLRPMTTYKNSDALISPDGRSLLIRVLGTRPPTDLDYATLLTDAIRAAAEKAQPQGLLVQFAGAYPIAALSQQSIRRDAIESIIGSILLLIGLFVVVYRRPIQMFHLAFIPVAMGTLWGFGAYGVLLQNLSPIAAVIGGVLAGMGIDYSVLYLTRYQTLRAEGMAAEPAARQTVNQIGSAVLAAFVTSVAGFLAIGASSVQALRDFAVLGTMGLTGSFLAAIFVLPAILVSTESGGSPAFRFGMTWLVEWSASHRRILLFTGGIMTAVCIAVAAHGPSLFHADADLTVLHPRPNAALDTELEIGRRFGISAGTMLVDLQAADNRQLLRLAYEVQRRLSAPKVRAAGIAVVYGLPAWLPDPAVVPSRRKNDSPQEADRVANDFQAAVGESPFDPKAFAGYATFLRRLVNPPSVPDISTLKKYPGLSHDLLPRQATDGHVQALTILWLSGDEESRVVRDTAVEAVRAALSDLSGATLTGLPVIGHDSDEAVRIELPRLLEVAAALVAGYLLLHFRNVRLMLLSLIPAIFGLAVLAALARWMGIALNIVNLVALPLLIGIDVDYGIYLVSLSRGSGSPAQRKTILAGGAHAVLVCATSMIAGYASLMGTSVPAIQSLGLVVSAGVASCLAGVLLVLCPMLVGNAGAGSEASSRAR